ncbi:hypothetical protein AWB69_05490 [Caballeronia udeis]|uniref:Uncharacterized protein n=1 Tax=Caballeronia udeis TaxID=1232866 RepID=A0A158I9G0_9BURK|nr:hypothetical protein [Caballeronia udeis]SAL52751.1 hypothetical protein AWB69_05490 [Caballeronia udeis]
MKQQDTSLASLLTLRRELDLHAGTKAHGAADAHKMQRFLAAIRDGCEMGHLARWRVRPTAGDEDEEAGQ